MSRTPLRQNLLYAIDALSRGDVETARATLLTADRTSEINGVTAFNAFTEAIAEERLDRNIIVRLFEGSGAIPHAQWLSYAFREEDPDLATSLLAVGAHWPDEATELRCLPLNSPADTLRIIDQWKPYGYNVNSNDGALIHAAVLSETMPEILAAREKLVEELLRQGADPTLGRHRTLLAAATQSATLTNKLLDHCATRGLNIPASTYVGMFATMARRVRYMGEDASMPVVARLLREMPDAFRALARWDTLHSLLDGLQDRVEPTLATNTFAVLELFKTGCPELPNHPMYGDDAILLAAVQRERPDAVTALLNLGVAAEPHQRARAIEIAIANKQDEVLQILRAVSRHEALVTASQDAVAGAVTHGRRQRALAGSTL